MSGSTDRMNYRDQRWGNQSWNGQPGANPPFVPYFVGPWAPMCTSRTLGIVATVLGFMIWWPIGMVLLVSHIWSGRMGLWTRRQENNGAPSPFNWGWTPPWAGMCGPRQTHAAPQPTSGNRAFDEYRSETLRRLEDEQHEFSDFLDRLRVAKDKSEFDQFMSDRRQRTSRPPVPPAGTGDHPDANPERN